MENGVMMQYFEWNLPESCGLWKQLAKDAAKLAEKGITALWLPPAYKGNLGANEVGYAVYDLYDLGEFDQKGSVATKYGTKDEYIKAIEACHKAGIEVYADIVFNHMVNGDKVQRVKVVEYDMQERNRQVSGEQTILARSRFTFPGRKGKYNTFTWNKDHFSGSDIDERNMRKSLFLFSGAKWSEDVDDENGNYDYLLGLNVNFEHPEVVSHLIDWGEWYLDTTHVDGFRLDALKHIDGRFFPGWLQEMRNHAGKDLFTVGEYWKGNAERLKEYIDHCGGCMSLFDVPLHYTFQNISHGNGLYDMSQIMSGSLTSIDPTHSVTFVDNHDTQPGQSLESSVADWFVPLAYAIILLRLDGYPCIFYGDYYGLEARGGLAFGEIIDRMLKLRHNCLCGAMHDYFDHPDVIGWTAEGDEEHKDSGLAVILSDRDEGEKTMYVGSQHAGETWTDQSGNTDHETVIRDDGNGVFRCGAGSVSFYAKRV